MGWDALILITCRDSPQSLEEKNPGKKQRLETEKNPSTVGNPGHFFRKQKNNTRMYKVKEKD